MGIEERRHKIGVKETKGVSGLKTHRIQDSIKDPLESHGFYFQLNPINRV